MGTTTTPLIVTTQDELDAALASGALDIEIRSPRGLWLAVSASGSATVRASGSATVSAYDSATVRASRYVAVHKHSTGSDVTGGVLIDVTTLDLAGPTTWAEMHGAETADGIVTLYKALDSDLVSGKAYKHVLWPTSGEVTCTDWRPDAECGHGLHLSPTPHHATAYNLEATRWLRCEVPLASIVPIIGGTAKCKVERCTVVTEVTIDGAEVTS